MNIVIYILSSLVLILLSLLIYTIIIKNRIVKKYEEDNRLFMYNKSKISMIEYEYRNFKEGQNPYTSFRKISDILKDYES